MTPGKIINAIIKKRGFKQSDVARQANISKDYVSKICNDALKSGDAYEKVLKVISIPHEIIIFKSFSCNNIQNEHQRKVMEKLLPEIAAQIDIVFDSKVD